MPENQVTKKTTKKVTKKTTSQVSNNPNLHVDGTGQPVGQTIPNVGQTNSNVGTADLKSAQGLVDNQVVKPDSAKQNNKVEVDADVLEQVLGRVKSLEQELADTKEIQQQYEETASQDQIAKIEKLRASGKLVKSVRLNFFNNKLVTSWRTTEDDVYIEAGTGKEICVQKMELRFLDADASEVSQIDFARRKMQREYEVIKEGKDVDGNKLYTVVLEGGRELEVDSRYIN
jgi:hypothetical protein